MLKLLLSKTKNRHLRWIVFVYLLKQKYKEESLFTRKLYWTKYNSVTFEGQVWRMNFDGTGKELVFDQMNFPRGITVDVERMCGVLTCYGLVVSNLFCVTDSFKKLQASGTQNF